LTVVQPAPTTTDSAAPVATTTPEVSPSPTPIDPSANPAPQTQTDLPPPPAAPTPVVADPATALTDVAASDSTGPIQAGQTLYPIAERARAEDVTVNQMMMALLQANPDAFIDGNVNRLKKGAVLRIPSKAEAIQLSEEQAAQLIRAQHSDFRRAPAPVPQPQESQVAQTPEPQPAPAESKPAEPAAPVAQAAPKPAAAKPSAAKPKSSSGRLEIAPPASKSSAARSAQSGAANNAGGTELRSELTQTKETLANRETELAELKSRVADLEKIDTDNDSLIEVQNSKINALEAELKQLREQQAAAPAVSAAPVAAANTAAQNQAAPPAASSMDMSSLTQAWWFYPSLAGLVALLLGGVWLARRGRKEPALDIPSYSKPSSPDLSDFMKTMPGPAAASTAAAADVFEPAPSAFEAEPEAAQQSVPIADELDSMRVKLKDHPSDLDAHLNLLRYHYERGDKRAYEDAARSMRVHVGTTLDARWREASVMGLSLLPGHPLFSTSSWNSPKFTEGGDANRADFQMPTSIQQSMPAAVAVEPVQSVEPMESEETSSGLPSFLAGVEIEKPEASTEISLDSYADIGLEPPHDQQRVEAQLIEEDANSATKIELAQAYLEIGDLDGARSMLHEVLAEGGPSARAEAERILNVLG
jgi:pilus assembly protein FimV